MSLLAWRPLVGPRLWRPLVLGLAVLVVVEAVWLLVMVIGPEPGQWLGMDAAYYRSLGARFLETGQMYEAHQLAGPYQARRLGEVSGVPSVLYPPHALALFAPFAVLPAFLWWAVPLGIIGWCAWSWRPAAWGVATALLLLVWPRAVGAFLFGNTDMWMAAGVAAGLRWGWPVVLVTIKPTLAPFALLALRSRWTLALVPVGVAVLAVTWDLWPQYLTAMRHMRGLDLGYSLGSLPLMLAPVALWAASGGVAERVRDFRRGTPAAGERVIIGAGGSEHGLEDELGDADAGSRP